MTRGINSRHCQSQFAGSSQPASDRRNERGNNGRAISRFVFSQVSESFFDRAVAHQHQSFFVVGGDNYGQGSSLEHAALAPRYPRLRVVIAKSFVRIHLQNLSNFGVLPLIFVDPEDWDKIDQDDVLAIDKVRSAISKGNRVQVTNRSKDHTYETLHRLT